MISLGLANAAANPPAGSPSRNVIFVGLYDPVDMARSVHDKWARIDPKIKNVTVVGPASGRQDNYNVDYPTFIRMSLNGRITATGTDTNVSRSKYNASHGSLGGTPGFNKRLEDNGRYKYSEDVRNSIRADQGMRDDMRDAGLKFVPDRDKGWYGFPATRPPKDLRE